MRRQTGEGPGPSSSPRGKGPPRNALGLAVQGESPYAECRTTRSLLAIFDRKFLGQTGELDLPMTGGLLSPGPTLLAIEVDDLEETFQRLTVTGTKFLSPPGHRIPLGRPHAFLRDPDRRTVALLGPRTTPRG